MKVLAVCGSGMGTSMIMEMKVKNVLKKLGIDANVGHSSLADAKANLNGYDLVVCSLHMASELNVKSPTKLVSVKNMLNEVELEEKIKEVGIGV